MSGLTRKHPTKTDSFITILHENICYRFPKKIAEKYRVDLEELVDNDQVFLDLNKKYTKPGALLKGIRIREGLSQAEMAHKLKITQSDISQMENGKRSIGKVIAKRIEKIFDVDYRLFLG